jgi:hypothetical protein
MNMKKALFIIGVPLALLVTDTVLSALLATGYGAIIRLNHGAHTLFSVPEAAIFLNLLRLLYFFLPTVLLFFVVSRIIHFQHNALTLSISNLLIYLFLCIVCVLVVQSFGKDMITNALFYIIALSTIISPWLLSISSRFKRVLALK